MNKTAVADELKAGVLKEIKLYDFKIFHDFDFILEKDSVYPNKYLFLRRICEMKNSEKIVKI